MAVDHGRLREAGETENGVLGFFSRLRNCPPFENIFRSDERSNAVLSTVQFSIAGFATGFLFGALSFDFLLNSPFLTNAKRGVLRDLAETHSSLRQQRENFLLIRQHTSVLQRLRRALSSLENSGAQSMSAMSAAHAAGGDTHVQTPGGVGRAAEACATSATFAAHASSAVSSSSRVSAAATPSGSASSFASAPSSCSPASPHAPGNQAASSSFSRSSPGSRLQASPALSSASASSSPSPSVPSGSTRHALLQDQAQQLQSQLAQLWERDALLRSREKSFFSGLLPSGREPEAGARSGPLALLRASRASPTPAAQPPPASTASASPRERLRGGVERLEKTPHPASRGCESLARRRLQLFFAHRVKLPARVGLRVGVACMGFYTLESALYGLLERGRGCSAFTRVTDWWLSALYLYGVSGHTLDLRPPPARSRLPAPLYGLSHRPQSFSFFVSQAARGVAQLSRFCEFAVQRNSPLFVFFFYRACFDILSYSWQLQSVV
ncbi:hypothetical protein BESB_029170 [Besnoitia besnoiti]|uniref:Transmembrane protein n=1 Tax=Besnoitia besnoiti TaxID=94643 RepID=A0A2A9M7Y1_BESBE|nr:uncharacterized protein BESB_029170 [Besnoitia besnoiti]PFH31482.1 hypothetical protein BESB_029170 [Besnoitia besnoiti]